MIYSFGFQPIQVGGCNVEITPSDVELEVRREILEGLNAERVNWHGNLNELDFLQSLYDLEQLPSNDSRYSNASGDFYQHRVNNPNDWDDDWIYSDKRFGLVDGELKLFLDFITKVVDPAVRRDEEESEEIAGKINRSLRRIGYELVPGDLTYSGVKYAIQALRPGTYSSRREISSPTRYDNEQKCPKAFNVEPWPLTRLGHVAVMMPFDAAFDSVYEAVGAACERLCLKPLRVDDIYGPTHIIDDVFRTIEQSQLVISDLTGRNPNVLYETGLAHARNRDVVMIVQNKDDVPFNLRHIRYVKYLPNVQGLEGLVVDLAKTIQAIQDQQQT